MLLKLSKFVYILFIFYIGWFQDVFFVIPRMPLTLGVGMIVILFFHLLSNDNMRVTIPRPLLIWIVFACYTLLTGLLVSTDIMHLVTSWTTYVQTLAMMFYIINVSELEKSNDFFIKSFFIYSLIYMLTMLFWGYTGRGGRLQLSATSNPNGDGLTLFAGVFCTLYLINKDKPIITMLQFGLVGMLVYTIILTGSRKSFIVVLFLIFLWLVLVFKKDWKSISTNRKILVTAIFVISFSLIIKTILPMFYESALYSRIVKRGITIGSEQIRSGMYKEAIDLFVTRPLFGVGFNHYRLLSTYRTYSHSTYAEIISTTGIIGTIIYFSGYFSMVKNLIPMYLNQKGSVKSSRAMQYLILLLSMLILGTGVIHFYGIRDSILFALIISFIQIEKTKHKDLKSKLH